jgi:hypothetical protein
MSNILTREAILAVRLRHEDVEVPALGGIVRVWELSAKQRGECIERGEGLSDAERGANLAAACLGGEAGPFNPPLSAAELLALPSSAYMRLLAVMSRLNVTSAAAAEEQRGN